MSLKKVKSIFSSLSGRLAASYFAFFALSASLIFVVLLYSIAQFLEQKDHDIIEASFQRYQEIFENEGIEGLKKIAVNTKLNTQSAKFLIFLSDFNQNPLFFHPPEEAENFSLKDLKDSLSTQKVPAKPTWFYIASKDGDKDAMEVRSVVIQNRYILSVGSSTDSRDEILEKMVNIFLSLLLPFLILAILGSIFIAKKSLQPIRQLIATATKIKDGDLSSRVPIEETTDELYELSLLFNEMIETVEGLITAMKDTLDNVAHDLKTPITRLKIASELALRSGDNDQARVALTEAIENCDEIHKLIKTIMTVAEISSDKYSLSRESFDLNRLVDEVVDIYSFVAEDKFIKINFNRNSGELLIRANRSLLKQAIANLLDNGIKYSHPNSQVDINCRAEDDKVAIQVRDSGIGISEKDLPRIWERLFRGDKSRHEPGLGLGLSMVRAIVEAHGGKIEVQSQDGTGSIFEIHFFIN